SAGASNAAASRCDASWTRRSTQLRSRRARRRSPRRSPTSWPITAGSAPPSGPMHSARPPPPSRRALPRSRLLRHLPKTDHLRDPRLVWNRIRERRLDGTGPIHAAILGHVSALLRLLREPGSRGAHRTEQRSAENESLIGRRRHAARYALGDVRIGFR